MYALLPDTINYFISSMFSDADAGFVYDHSLVVVAYRRLSGVNHI